MNVCSWVSTQAYQSNLWTAELLQYTKRLARFQREFNKARVVMSMRKNLAREAAAALHDSLRMRTQSNLMQQRIRSLNARYMANMQQLERTLAQTGLTRVEIKKRLDRFSAQHRADVLAIQSQYVMTLSVTCAPRKHTRFFLLCTAIDWFLQCFASHFSPP